MEHLTCFTVQLIRSKVLFGAQKVVYLGVTVIVAQSLKMYFLSLFFQAKVWPASVGKVH